MALFHNTPSQLSSSFFADSSSFFAAPSSAGAAPPSISCVRKKVKHGVVSEWRVRVRERGGLSILQQQRHIGTYHEAGIVRIEIEARNLREKVAHEAGVVVRVVPACISCGWRHLLL